MMCYFMESCISGEINTWPLVCLYQPACVVMSLETIPDEQRPQEPVCVSNNNHPKKDARLFSHLSSLYPALPR